MEQKQFKSLVWRVIVLPLTVMGIIGIISLIGCTLSFVNVQKEIMNSKKDSIQIAQVQMEPLSIFQQLLDLVMPTMKQQRLMEQPSGSRLRTLQFRS